MSFALASSIVRRVTSNRSDAEPIQYESGEIPFRWNILEEDGFEESVEGWISKHVWDKAGKPLVLSPWQDRLIAVFFEDDIEEGDKAWDLTGWTFQRKLCLTREEADRIYADNYAYWARRDRSLSRRQSADHLGGRPRLRYGRRRIRWRGDGP